MSIPILYKLTPAEEKEIEGLALYLGSDEADMIIFPIMMKAHADRLRAIYQEAVDRMAAARTESNQSVS